MILLSTITALILIFCVIIVERYHALKKEIKKEIIYSEAISSIFVDVIEDLEFHQERRYHLENYGLTKGQKISLKTLERKRANDGTFIS